MMRAPGSLFELEWSRLRPYLPYDARGRILWIGVPFLLIVCSAIFLDGTATARSVFAIGAVLAALAAWTVGTLMTATIWESSFKDWWLSMPQPREKLMRAKAAALIRFQAYISLATWATCSASGLVRIALGELDPESVSLGSFLLDAAAYLVLYAAVVPIFICAGLAFMGMYGGSRTWLNVPFVLLFVVLISAFPAIGDHTIGVDRWLRADAVALYALAVLALAKPFYAWTIRFVAVYGLRDLAAHRPGGTGTKKKGAAREEAAKIRYRAAKPGFAALYALEESRYKDFLFKKAIRIVWGILTAATAVGGFFASTGHANLIGIYQTILMPTSLVPAIILVTLNQHEANKKRLSWWLCFPYDRRKLMLSRFLAVWGAALRVLASLLLAYAAGCIAQELTYGQSAFNGMQDIRIMLYLLLVYVGGGFIVSCVLLGQSLTFRSKALAWIYGPLAGLVYLLPMLVNKKFFPEEAYETGVSSGHWLGLALSAVVLLPAAFACFRAGAKWMHLYLLNTQEDIARRRHLGAKGK
jgi:hypothetical protein